MARKCKWTVVTGYDDHKPYLGLIADGGVVSEADCVKIAAALLNHVRTMQSHRDALTRERKQHEADIAFEEAEAARSGGSHRKVR